MSLVISQKWHWRKLELIDYTNDSTAHQVLWNGTLGTWKTTRHTAHGTRHLAGTLAEM
jgi:hypothetical protein